jgi:DNA-binding MarR family transcriptional regulator/GNAT superfamily N-acetyltransferase
MHPGQIATVRRFNRLATQRAGALEGRFLGRDRPLGESRVLFEIGREGASLRHLRSTLGLDSGYLSRLVQALVAKGLARLETGAEDERVRQARLTRSGLAELDEINRRSDEAAKAILTRLSEGNRSRLAAGMEEVHLLLTAAGVEFREVGSTSPAAKWCLSRYFEELARRFDTGFDPERSVAARPSEFSPPNGVFLVAEVDGRTVGSGCVTRVGPRIGYIKRMWLDESLRGLGLGRRLLAALERAAEGLGCFVVRLETNSALHQAIQLYKNSGYEEVDAFNDEVYAHHWFEKGLG